MRNFFIRWFRYFIGVMVAIAAIYVGVMACLFILKTFEPIVFLVVMVLILTALAAGDLL